MSKTLSGAEHQVLGSGSDEIASGSGKHGGYPRTENSATVGTEILPLFFVRNVCSDDERCASRLCAQRAKCDEVYIFTVEEIKAACDQVSQVAESVLRQVGGLFGGVWVFRTVCFERVVLSSPGCLWPGRMDDHEEVLEAYA